MQILIYHLLHSLNSLERIVKVHMKEHLYMMIYL
nr:MAG TPA: hypothetical protein [Caudoviricetes sp.]